MQRTLVLSSFLLLGGLCKLFVIVTIYRLVLPKTKKASHALLLSWMFTYLYMMASFLLLSCFRWVNGMGLVILMIVGTLGAMLYGNYKRLPFPRPSIPQLPPAAWVAFAVGVAVLGWLTLRSLYFYDNTWDAMVYGLPRLSVYGHHQTLFVHQNTGAANVFANEWVGELNALYYMLIAGNEQATGFGNVENLVFLFLIFYWLLDERGVPDTLKMCFSLLLVTTPSVLGLSMTVKGDLLAAGFLALTYGLFRKYQEEPENSLSLFSLLCALGLCTGAKIMLVPATGLLCLLLLYDLLRSGRLNDRWRTVLLGLSTFLISCSRYVLNLLVYHTPFMRVEGEGLRPGLESLLSNMRGLAAFLFGRESLRQFASIMERENTYVLLQGLGLLPFLLIPCALWTIYILYRNRRGRAWLLHAAMLGGAFFFAFTTGWERWSLRYFLPWVLLYAALALAVVQQKLGRGSDRLEVMACLSLVIIVIGAGSMTGYTDARPVSYKEATSIKSELQRKTMGYSGLYRGLTSISQISDAIRGPADILILQSPDIAVYPYMGDRYRNNVQFTGTREEFLEHAAKGLYDCLVVAGARVYQPQYITPEVVLMGYDVISYQGYDTVVYYKGDSMQVPEAFDPTTYPHLDRISVGVAGETKDGAAWLQADAWTSILSEGLKHNDLTFTYAAPAHAMRSREEGSDPWLELYVDDVLVYREALKSENPHTAIIKNAELPATEKPYYVFRVRVWDVRPDNEQEELEMLRLYYLGPTRS